MRPIFHLSMVEKHFRSLFSLILVLSVFYKAFSDELNSDRAASFKCTTDGLFEDENNCQMYYECLWVGTMFEKQEHVRCPRKLIYNPRKHRCDNIFEFENQFANGIQTGEELIEFMRFRNCIGTRNLVIGAGGEEDAGGGGGATISDDSTTPRPYNTNEDPYYSVLVANTSPPTDYWPPKLYLFDEGAQANTEAAAALTKDDITTTTSTSTTSTESITSEDSKKIKTTATETTETTKSRQSPTTETSSSSSSTTTTTTSTTTNGKSTLEPETDLKQRFLPLAESILSSKKLKRVFTPPASQQGTKHQPKKTNLDKLLDMATTNKHQQAVEIETNKIISEPTETTFVNRNNGSSLSSSSSINGMKTNNGTFIIFGSESMLASINKPSDASLNAGVGAVKSKMSLRKRNRKLNPTFLKRRLLSVNDIEESSTTFDDDEFESPTTILDDEEIESTDASYHDKEAAIHEFTNKIINDFNQNHNQSTNTTTKPTTTTTTTASLDISTSTITTTTNETTVQANLIDSIEQRLTKRGENAVRIEKKLVVENSTSKVVLLKGPAVVSTTTEENKEPVMISLSLVHEDDSSTIPEYSTTTRNYKITASSRPLKFLKMLPAVNMSTVEHEKKQLKLDKLNDMFEKKLGSVKHQKSEQPKSQIGDTEKDLELDELANASKQQRTHRKLPTRTSSTYSSTPMPETATGSSTPYILVTSGWTTPRGLNVSRVLSSTLSWTSSVAADPATNPAAPAVNGFVPSKTNSKPFMQTYKINQSKHLPNQFASLRLNYAAGSGKIEDSISVSTAPEASSFFSTNVYTDATTTNPFTKIDELERGGKFQRLRLVPADTLIECKENDFGLECSCSITLSPPRCKQLINSFLSSCRILGCKNSGKCINMSYKYPIPYVCSCPSGFMGTYCEIKRGDPTSSSAASSKEDKDSGLILTPVLRPKSQIDSAHRSYSSPYKLHPTNGVKQKTATTSTPATTTEATSILEEHTSTRVFELKSSSATFNLSLATFNRLTTQLPKLKKTFTTTPDFEFKEPLCEPNPCQNDAKCMVINDKIRCLCINSSYTGKYCEHSKLSHHHHRHHTTSTSMTSVDPETTPEGIIEITTSTMATTSSGRRRTTTGGAGNTQAAATSTSSSEQRYAYYQSSTSAPRGFKHVSTLLPIPINNHDESSTPLPFYQVQKQPTTRAYFWQCPSNCFYSLGRGFCALSQSGYPHCVCHMGWTSVDCSQKNYCADNDCSNNSTCVNYPETSTYICLCPPGYSGRFCESHMSNRVVLEVKEKDNESSSTSAPNKNFYRLVTPTMNNNQQSHQQSDSKQQRLQSSILPPKNPCLTEKCKNNGTCVMSFSHAKNRFSFVCKCAPGFFGHLCENSTATTASDTTIVTPLLETDKAKPTPISPQSIAKNNRRVKPIFKSSSSSSSSSSTNPLDASFNPCTNDMDLCRKQPHGNASFICVKSFITQDYTLCLPTKSMSCKESNPCLNGGICVDQEDEIGGESSTKEPSGIRPPWRCICSVEYTGRLCETEICSPIHKLFANHTMCMPNSQKFVTGGLASSDIDLILDMHNTLRRQVAPIASNMQKMYWDIRLQYLAQKRAQLCSVENTGILMRQQPGYGIVIGENLAAGYEKWAHVLSSWMGERKFFIYKSNSPTDNLQAGHYTQMIYSSASRIGCGFSQCTNTTYDRYFVCYYGEMQTYYSRYEPYQDGKSCSSCENNCDNGLCDCKGAYCLNGGTMDLRTCTCSCPYSTFSGRYCENVICPSQDSPFCSQTLFEDKCWLYPVVRATCPYMCSLCTRYNENVNASVSFNSVNENFRY